MTSALLAFALILWSLEECCITKKYYKKSYSESSTLTISLSVFDMASLVTFLLRDIIL